MGSNASATEEGGNPDCVICLSEPRDTAVLPCRHMCFCSYCAGIVRLQCDRCPVCRQKVLSLLQFQRGKEDGTVKEEIIRSSGNTPRGSGNAGSSGASPYRSGSFSASSSSAATAAPCTSYAANAELAIVD